jgi:hypothetical protein
MTTDNLYPIYYETIAEVHKEQPAVVAGFLDAIAFFGMGVSVYGNDKILTRKEVGEFIKELNAKKDPKAMEKLRSLINKQNKLKGIKPENTEIEPEEPREYEPITMDDYEDLINP